MKFAFVYIHVWKQLSSLHCASLADGYFRSKHLHFSFTAVFCLIFIDRGKNLVCFQLSLSECLKILINLRVFQKIPNIYHQLLYLLLS